MAVVATKHEPKCKICSNPRREDIDKILELRSQRKTDPVTGRQYNLEYVLEILDKTFGVQNPNEDNIKLHYRKHCQIVSDAERDDFVQLEQDIARELGLRYELEGLRGVDSYAKRIVEIAEVRLMLELKQGRLPRVSLDQASKMIDTTTKRKQSDATVSLMDALVGGIAKHHGLPVASSAPAQIEATADDYEEIEE